MVDDKNNSKLGQMPQNDVAQIDQIQIEYESRGKGLAHGFQKDAIQNGAGARKNKNIKNPFGPTRSIKIEHKKGPLIAPSPNAN